MPEAKPKDGKTRDRRVHPKLSVILNGDEGVNTVRAEQTGCLRVAASLAATQPSLLSAVSFEQVAAKEAAVGKLSAKKRAVDVNVFIEATDPSALKNVKARQGELAIATVRLDEVDQLLKNPAISYISNAENLKLPNATRASASQEAPAPRSEGVADADRHKKGAGVLIGIVDVEGFDFAHPDFMKAGKSRFIRIWDQGAKGTKPKGRRNFDYGNELTEDRLAKAITGAAKIHVSPHDIEPQSQMVVGSHGTHVASIAAGNCGVCPEAVIAAVLVSLPAEDFEDRRKAFYDSTRLVDAIEYLINLADELGLPVSINVSLGTNGHAHDGSSALDRWLDAWLIKPGRSICVAAGNAGQEAPQHPGDWGYMLGRIHTSGRIAGRGLNHDLEWIVEGDGLKDISENELEIWYEAQDRFTVHVKPPDSDWIGPIDPGEYLENYQIPKLKTLISIYNELFHPTNGHNYISVYLTPFWKKPIIGIKPGRWIVRLTGLDVRDGRFHGWIERDDPAPVEDQNYYFPSYFSERSNVDTSSVSSLACGQRVVSVANLDEVEQRINVSSSQGPTRDGRLKPDVAAAGTRIRAANGFGQIESPWVAMTGTSMASPYVAGVIGLMLAAQPNLNAAQVNGIIKATAKPLPGKTYEWTNDCGFGVIDATACVALAASVNVRTDIKGRMP